MYTCDDTVEFHLSDKVTHKRCISSHGSWREGEGFGGGRGGLVIVYGESSVKDFN